PNSLVSLATVQSYVDSRASGIVQLRRQTSVATNGQQDVPITAFQYVPGTENLSVYVDGVRKFYPVDYDETDATHITFVTPFTGGEVLELFSTEFVGNISLPVHTHAWTDIFGAP